MACLLNCRKTVQVYDNLVASNLGHTEVFTPFASLRSMVPQKEHTHTMSLVH